MHLSFLISSENYELLLCAITMLTNEVRLIEVHRKHFVVTVVSMGVIFPARMAGLVVFFHVFDEVRHVEKIHLTKLAPWMEKNNLSISVNFSFFKVNLELFKII